MTQVSVPGIRRVDADVHHFRHVHAPVAHHAEAFLVPVRIGDDVDGNIYAQRAGELQSLEIATQRDAFAELAQAVLIDRLDTEKDVGDPELLPELEDLLVAKEHVAARFQIEVLADALARDRFADGKTVPLLDERHIIDDEYARLGNRDEILDDPLRTDEPIAAPVEGPGAAERAIPGAAAGKFDRGARVEDTDEIFTPVADEIARRPHLVEMLHEGGWWPVVLRSDRSGDFGNSAAVALERFEQLDDGRLAFSFKDAVDRPRAMLQNSTGGEGGAVAADTDEGVPKG